MDVLFRCDSSLCEALLNGLCVLKGAIFLFYNPHTGFGSKRERKTSDPANIMASSVVLKAPPLPFLSPSRPLAYSTLADLVHHVRQNLPLTDLSLAVQLFAKNIDDESLPSNIQTMSCKLLLNLVDCIRSKSELENGNGRDILMRMLEVNPRDHLVRPTTGG